VIKVNQQGEKMEIEKQNVREKVKKIAEEILVELGLDNVTSEEKEKVIELLEKAVEEELKRQVMEEKELEAVKQRIKEYLKMKGIAG